MIKGFFLVIIGILLGLSGCYTLKGHVGNSENIAESKRINAFICEYKVDSNSNKINDTLNIVIKEIWLEKMWHFTGPYSLPKIVDNHYQLCILTTAKSLKGFRDSWTIGNDNFSELGDYSDNILGIEMDSIPNRLEYNVYQGSFVYDNIGRKIGRFILKKK
jgi:hypothetical protein